MRELDFINRIIDSLELDLQGLTVFTEAASGHFQWTPVIAALAGAQKVYGLAKDSPYASIEAIRKNYKLISQKIKAVNKIEVVVNKDCINKADIVTNSGFVRPLTKGDIKRLKPTAVIPLMYETWEFRPQDLDLKECLKRDIMVMGTNEHHELLRTVEYVGLTVLKLLQDFAIKIKDSKILVLGSSFFLAETVKILRQQRMGVTSFDINKKLKEIMVTGRYDAVVCVEHINHDVLLIGKDGLINQKNSRAFAAAKIIHLCGKVDMGFIRKERLEIIPKTPARPGYMSFNVAYVGPQPVIDLQAAGLKVGEIMARLRLLGIPITRVKKAVLKSRLATSFPKKR